MSHPATIRLLEACANLPPRAVVPATMGGPLVEWTAAGCPDLPSAIMFEVAHDRSWRESAERGYLLRHAGRDTHHETRVTVERLLGRTLAEAEWDDLRESMEAGIQHIDEICASNGWWKRIAPPDDAEVHPSAITPEDAAAAYRGTDEDSEPEERCEGCKEPATCEDAMGVPLCDKCFDSLPEVPGE